MLSAVNKIKGILVRFLIWRARHIPHRRFVLILSFVIGLVSGGAAVVLKNTVHFTSNLILGHLDEHNAHLLFLMYPMIGILLTVLFVRYFVKDNLGHGVSRILYAISKQGGYIKPHNNYSSMVASTLTVGFGGSVGLEAPIVLTGSSIGSTFARLLRQNFKTTTLLIGCGAAGAIAGIFKAPIAAVLFGLEILMLDLTMSSLLPLLISAVTGATVSYFFMGKGVIFSFMVDESYFLGDMPYYIVLGIITGLVSTYFTRITIWLESVMAKVKNIYSKIAIGGISLGLLIYLFPPLYGEGYDTLIDLFNDRASEIMTGTLVEGYAHQFWVVVGFLLLVLLFKVFATALTSGSGGVGGIFAPSLFMGGVVGYLSALLINSFDFFNISPGNFALVGMAGVMAGVMHAPLTAIFLIAEITGGYQLFIPLITTATIAYLTIMYFEPHSIYTKRLAARGELLTHNKDKSILQLIKIHSVIEKDLKKVHPDDTLRRLVKTISKSKRNIFPVVDEENTLLGIVLLDNIREIIFNTEMYDEMKVSSLMIMPPATVSTNDTMEAVMTKFNETGAWNLPVVNQGKYVGFISKSKLFSIYRKWLVDISMT
ncbi:MAG: chloride channel protein [Bacteroidota bacterium]